MVNHKLFCILILVLNCCISSFSQILLKKSSLRSYDSVIKEYLNPYVIIGYGLFFVVLLVNVLLLKYLPIAIVNPVGETLPIVLAFFSGMLFFNEEFTFQKVLGIIIIISGIIVILI